jgi:hypothetical protein
MVHSEEMRDLLETVQAWIAAGSGRIHEELAA